MEFPSCPFVFISGSGIVGAFLFFTRNVIVPLIFDAELTGTLEEIKGITGNSNEKFITIRAYNGQVNFDESGKTKKPHGSASHVGYLERKLERYIRYTIDLKTGKGKIERIN